MFFQSIYISRAQAEIRPEEQSEKTESCRENLWNEIHSLKGLKDRNRHKNTIKRSGQVQLVYVTSPPLEGELVGTATLVTQYKQ